MYGNWFSKSGKRVSEDKMTSVALIEAKGWADQLMNREFKGRGDREKSARYRLAKRTGVPESYLFRLQYKTKEMKDVAGEVYRRLRLAYDQACLTNEEAADRYRAERLAMDGTNEATDEKSHAARVGMASSEMAKAKRG
jgi:hypothetical protein